MGKPGTGIKRIIRKYAKQREIIRFDRDTTEYVNGILQPVENDKEFINIHTQPIGSGDLIEDLPEGQRQKDVKKGWSLDTIGKKDQIILLEKNKEILHTVNAIQVWPESDHTECDLIRTGEQDNIVS